MFLMFGSGVEICPDLAASYRAQLFNALGGTGVSPVLVEFFLND
jgi:hypothetical protein